MGFLCFLPLPSSVFSDDNSDTVVHQCEVLIS